jgi:hypothetical protein
MWLQPSLSFVKYEGINGDMHCIPSRCIIAYDVWRKIYDVWSTILYMNISTRSYFIYTLVCLNWCLINYDLNNLLPQFACWGFFIILICSPPPPLGTSTWRSWVWDGIRDTCMRSYLIDLPNTCVVIIKFTFDFSVLYWFNLYDDSCFCLLCSLCFMAIFLLSLLYYYLVVL